MSSLWQPTKAYTSIITFVGARRQINWCSIRSRVHCIECITQSAAFWYPICRVSDATHAMTNWTHAVMRRPVLTGLSSRHLLLKIFNNPDILHMGYQNAVNHAPHSMQRVLDQMRSDLKWLHANESGHWCLYMLSLAATGEDMHTYPNKVWGVLLLVQNGKTESWFWYKGLNFRVFH